MLNFLILPLNGISFCLLAGIILYLCALDGWGPLYALCVVPLAVCSGLCLWAAWTNRERALVFFSVILFIVGFGLGCIGLLDNEWKGNRWDWYRFLFLLAVAPGITLHHFWGWCRFLLLIIAAPAAIVAILFSLR